MGSHFSNCIIETEWENSFLGKNGCQGFLTLFPSVPVVKKQCSASHSSVSTNDVMSPENSNNTPSNSNNYIRRSQSLKGNLKQSASPKNRAHIPNNETDLSAFTILMEFNSERVYKCKKYLVSKKTNPHQIFTMTNCKKNLLEKYFNELFLLQRQIYESKNPFISRIHYLIENKTNLFIFQSYFSGSDLVSQILRIGPFKEKVARFYLVEMILAFEHLPYIQTLQQGLIYCLDLKSMLIDRDGHLCVNLISAMLGLSQKIGSPHDENYHPPEIIKNPDGKEKINVSSVLAWKLGVFLFEMLTGEKPFKSGLEILESNLKFPHEFSGNAVEFIRQMLLKNPQKRIGKTNLAELKSHDFFAEVNWNEMLERKRIGPLASSSKEENNILFVEEKNSEEKVGFNKLERFIDFPNSTAEKSESVLSEVFEVEDEEFCLDNHELQ